MDANELMWRQYVLIESQNKTYIDIVLRFTTFYFGISGAILSFFFINRDIPLVQFTLGLPPIVGIMFSIIYLYYALSRIPIDNEELTRVGHLLFYHVHPYHQNEINKIFIDNPKLKETSENNPAEFVKILRKNYDLNIDYSVRTLDALKHFLIVMSILYIIISAYFIFVFFCFK